MPARFYDRFRHRFTDVEQVRLHHVDGGPGDGEAGGLPLGAAARGGGEAAVLPPVGRRRGSAGRTARPALRAAGSRVLAAANRGAGDSGRPLGGYDRAAMAPATRNLLDRLGLDRVPL